MKTEREINRNDELKEYSDGVQKRIAKLTRKMREAERQKEEAVAYAQSIKIKMMKWKDVSLRWILLMFLNLKVELKQV